MKNGQVEGKLKGQGLDKPIVMFIGRILEWISELVTVLLFLCLPPLFLPLNIVHLSGIISLKFNTCLISCGYCLDLEIIKICTENVRANFYKNYLGSGI